MIDSGRVERPVGAGQDAGADLDDPGPGRQDDVVADQVARTVRSPAGVAGESGDRTRSSSRFGDYVRCSRTVIGMESFESPCADEPRGIRSAIVKVVGRLCDIIMPRSRLA